MKRKKVQAIAGAIASVLLLAPAVTLAGGNQYKLLKLEGHFAKWHTATSTGPTVVTFAFAKAVVHHKGARNCGAMQPVGATLNHSDVSATQFREEFVKAARMWEEAANIRFVEAKTPQSANILVGLQLEGFGRAFTNVKLTSERIGPGTQSIERSLICLNPDMPWKIGFDGDLSAYDLRYTLAHELGHAIGLDHPSNAGTLMFYKYDETRHGLTAGDMTGAAAIYGAGPRLTGGETAAKSAGTGMAARNAAVDGEEAGDNRSHPSSFALGEKP